jgi:uncharacterized BrkB/YihY/UPF0761 family membrane protein
VARARIIERAETTARRAQEWTETRPPQTKTGVALGAWRLYRDVDGPRQSLVLTAYFVLAVLPALLVVEEYVERKPGALATHLVRHYNLNGQTAEFLRSVLSQDETHKLGSALFAIAGALFFGLGFGQVLQRVNMRIWGLDAKATIGDQARYVQVLLALTGMFLLLMAQTAALAGHPSWAGLAIAPGWVALLLLYFWWSPYALLHRHVAPRDLLPGAVITAAGLVVLMLISSFVMGLWVDLYARDYGGLGVVMAIFFWIGLSSTTILLGAAAGRALVERRDVRAASKR